MLEPIAHSDMQAAGKVRGLQSSSYWTLQWIAPGGRPGTGCSRCRCRCGLGQRETRSPFYWVLLRPATQAGFHPRSCIGARIALQDPMMMMCHRLLHRPRSSTWIMAAARPTPQGPDVLIPERTPGKDCKKSLSCTVPGSACVQPSHLSAASTCTRASSHVCLSRVCSARWHAFQLPSLFDWGVTGLLHPNQ